MLVGLDAERVLVDGMRKKFDQLKIEVEVEVEAVDRLKTSLSPSRLRAGRARPKCRLYTAGRARPKCRLY